MRPALVVIDVQRDFCAPDGMLAQRGRDVSAMPQLVSVIASLIARADAAGVPVLYAQQIYDEERLTPLQKLQFRDGRRLITCDIRTNGHHFYRLQPPPAAVYRKTDFNIFSNRLFEERLLDLGIDTLVITGVDTQYCVESAIRSAFDRGYRVIVPYDAVATNGKHLDMHNRTLALTRKVFGEVISADSLWPDVPMTAATR